MDTITDLIRNLDITPLNGECKTKNTVLDWKCTKCQTTHTCSLWNYSRRKIKCCEVAGKQFKERKPKDRIDGRDCQVKFELIKSRIEEICEKRNGQCLDPDSYINHQTKLSWQCNVCNHVWQAMLNNVYCKESWCPNCVTKYEGEKKCRTILEYMFTGYKFSSVRPGWLSGLHGKNLELDCYNEELKLALEKNGIQHEKLDMYMHRPKNHRELSPEELKQACEDNFKRYQENDRIKAELCDTKGIKLVIIPYKIGKIQQLKRAIHEKVKYKLDELGITVDPEWLKTDILELPADAPSINRKQTILDYIEDHKLQYQFVKPDTVIGGFRDKFELKCVNNHVFATHHDNLINSGRRCGECQVRIEWTNESRKKYIEDFQCTVLTNEIETVNTKVDYRCNVCQLSCTKLFSSIQRFERKHGHICKVKH